MQTSTSKASRALSDSSDFFGFLLKVTDNRLTKPISYSTIVNQVRRKVITFGSGFGGLGSGKSPIKRRIIVHIATAACNK